MICDTIRGNLKLDNTTQNPLNNNYDMTGNMSSKCPNKLLKCHNCSKTFALETDLDIHSDTCFFGGPIKTNRRSPMPCPICQKTLKGRQSLKTHMAIHSEDRPFSCGTCSKPFKIRSGLIQHLTTHYKARPFYCSICGKSYKTNIVLNRHILTHSDERPFTCSICPLSFKVQQHLDRHMLSHSEEKPFSCSVCEKSFKSDSYLTKHMAYHSRSTINDEEKPYSCSICMKSFKIRKNIKRHMMVHSERKPIVQSERKPITCSICKTPFDNKRSLTQHMKTVCRSATDIKIDLTGGVSQLNSENCTKKVARLQRCISKLMRGVENEDQSDEAVSQDEHYLNPNQQRKRLTAKKKCGKKVTRLNARCCSENEVGNHSDDRTFFYELESQNKIVDKGKAICETQDVQNKDKNESELENEKKKDVNAHMNKKNSVQQKKERLKNDKIKGGVKQGKLGQINKSKNTSIPKQFITMKVTKQDKEKNKDDCIQERIEEQNNNTNIGKGIQQKIVKTIKVLDEDVHIRNDEQQAMKKDHQGNEIAVGFAVKEEKVCIVETKNEYYLDPPIGWRIWKNWEEWDHWKIQC